MQVDLMDLTNPAGRWKVLRLARTVRPVLTEPSMQVHLQMRELAWMMRVDRIASSSPFCHQRLAPQAQLVMVGQADSSNRDHYLLFVLKKGCQMFDPIDSSNQLDLSPKLLERALIRCRFC